MKVKEKKHVIHIDRDGNKKELLQSNCLLTSSSHSIYLICEINFMKYFKSNNL